MGHHPRGLQEHIMTAVYDHVQSGSAATITAAMIAQQLDRPSPDVVRALRRCAREGLVTTQEYLGEDNPSVLRLTTLGRQWVERRLDGPAAP
jgi:hypothetical protein